LRDREQEVAGWFKEHWPRISACGPGRKGCGDRGRGSRPVSVARARNTGGGQICQVGSFCQRDAEAGRALDCGRRRVGPGAQGERARRGGESLGCCAGRG